MDSFYFLGANTYEGFVSLYEPHLNSLKPQFVYVLKGGAGCGKSGFMKRIGQRMQEAGMEVRRVLCSGDPDSLDGIYIPELQTVLFDGTAPHVLEPGLVGQKGFYIDLSRFYQKEAGDLSFYDTAYREHYRKAYAYLGAAGKLDSLRTLTEEAAEVIEKRADALVKKELKRMKNQTGANLSLFTEAFTWKGLISLPEMRQTLCQRLIALHGGAEETNSFLLRFQKKAFEMGYHTISCLDPLRPARISHVLLPEVGLGITMGNGQRMIHLERLTRSGRKQSEQMSQKKVERLQSPLLQQAKSELALAHIDHDRLEEQVNPLIDFEAVYHLADQYAMKLLDHAAASSIRSIEIP